MKAQDFTRTSGYQNKSGSNAEDLDINSVKMCLS